MILRAVVIDDEKSNIENLTSILDKYCKNVKIVGSTENSIAGIDLIKQIEPDLVFLDIEMPFASGFDILESFSEVNFEVIFITAYNHYAIKAIKLCALDYLLKPIDIFELKNAIQKVEKKYLNKTQNEEKKIFLQNIRNSSGNKKIALTSLEKVEFITLDNIIRCKGENNYTNFFIKDHKEILVSKTLKEFEKLLSEFHFLRVHQSHLVNISHVKSYIKSEGGYLIMSDNSKIMISRSKKNIVQKLLNNYMLNK
jgi:two-component system LytT family response regulator